MELLSCAGEEHRVDGINIFPDCRIIHFWYCFRMEEWVSIYCTHIVQKKGKFFLWSLLSQVLKISNRILWMLPCGNLLKLPYWHLHTLHVVLSFRAYLGWILVMSTSYFLKACWYIRLPYHFETIFVLLMAAAIK